MVLASHRRLGRLLLPSPPWSLLGYVYMIRTEIPIVGNWLYDIAALRVGD